jgi:hypothetical protein
MGDFSTTAVDAALSNLGLEDFLGAAVFFAAGATAFFAGAFFAAGVVAFFAGALVASVAFLVVELFLATGVFLTGVFFTAVFLVTIFAYKRMRGPHYPLYQTSAAQILQNQIRCSYRYIAN